MILTYKDVELITFPVYRLPSDNWWSQDGLLFVDEEIVDDKNMPGETLGIRRMQTYFQNLLELRFLVSSHRALLKQPKGYFIDSLGKCFIYEKTKFCKLIYHKIKRVEYKDTHCLLRLRGIPFPFTIPRPPKPSYTWAGLLHMDGLPWMLYEYAETKLASTRRKV